MLRKLINHLGFDLNSDADDKPFASADNYEGNDLSRLKLHRDFLKSIENDENSRVMSIENKTSQLISQTGIIFALLSLFIPLILDKIEFIQLKLIFLGILFWVYVLYSLTIYNGLKNYFIKKFPYSRVSAANVITHKDSSEEVFLVEEIRDLLHCIDANTRLTNRKGRNLNYAYIAFRNATVLSGVLVLLLCFSMVFWPPKKEPISIQNPIRVEQIETK